MDLGSLLAPRSLDDTFAERVRLRLGGVEYFLPVKSMRDNRIWEEGLDRELVRLFALVREDGDDVAAVLAALSEDSWSFVDLLLSYDDGDILPDRETIDANETEIGLLVACLEVWRAAHPLADIGLALFALRKLMTDQFQPLRGRASSLWLNGDTPADDSRPN